MVAYGFAGFPAVLWPVCLPDWKALMAASVPGLVLHRPKWQPAGDGPSGRWDDSIRESDAASKIVGLCCRWTGEAAVGHRGPGAVVELGNESMGPVGGSSMRYADGWWVAGGRCGGVEGWLVIRGVMVF